MASSTGNQIMTLLLRVLSATALFASVVIVGINNLTLRRINEDETIGEEFTVHFYNVVGFRYLFAVGFIGAAYSIGQIVCTVIQMAKGIKGSVSFDFYAEEVMSNFFASGAVAGFIAAAQYVKWWTDYNGDVDHHFINMSYLASGLIIFAFIISFVLSVRSSYALSRDDDDEPDYVYDDY